MVDWEKFSRIREKLESKHELISVVLALESYNLTTGKYPDDLNELKPDYINEIPVDRYSHRPICYVRENAGYRVYSFGPDGVDHQGAENGRDIVIRLSRE
jgi:hypothetical protein